MICILQYNFNTNIFVFKFNKKHYLNVKKILWNPLALLLRKVKIKISYLKKSVKINLLLNLLF